jgi:tetratricopeptide (TPR) repeat protein
MHKTRRQPLPTRSEPVSERKKWPAPDLWISLALLIATFAVYAQVRTFEFLNHDDPIYVSHNPHVRQGLTPESLRWAFTSGEGANWFPLTRLSHLLDAQLFGMDAGWHHLTNAAIHALAVLLLFAFLLRATQARWPSAFVAFLFALHPLHVESVAWVSERKDVLCALFWMLALWCWVRYVEHSERRWYLLSLAAFIVGLLSKPMIVSLPLLLLLLDFWPLQRNAAAGWKKLILEKVPFAALAAVASIVTYLVQQASGAVRTFGVLPTGLRIANALVSYVAYLWMLVWPANLAVFYPYPLELAWWKPALAAALLIAITWFVLRSLRVRPYLAVGWFWYLATLIPVIGIVQVGGQARADRYMYVPMIGLGIAVAWGAADLLRPWPSTMKAIAAIACLACTVLTWRQLEFWHDSVALFQHAVDVTERNDLAQHQLGNALLEVPGRLPDAIAHLQESVSLNPDSPRSRTDLGNALSKLPGRLPDAIAQYRAAIRIDPEQAIPHSNLCGALADTPGGDAEAIVECQTAIRLDPGFAAAHRNLGSALAKSGRLQDAIHQLEIARSIDPDDPETRNDLEMVRAAMDPGTEYNLGLALAKVPGRLPDAIAHFEAALRIDPNNAEAHNNLGFALTNYPARMPEAIRHFETAVQLKPDYADAQYNLGVALSNVPGKLSEAIQHLEAAERLHPDPELEQQLKRLRAGSR